MPISLSTGLACLFVHSGAPAVIQRTAATPESTILFLLGSGLVALASLVRRHYPLGGVAAPKSLQMIVWISPQEIAEHLSGGIRTEDAANMAAK
jgi:hypothetical protein